MARVVGVVTCSVLVAALAPVTAFADLPTLVDRQNELVAAETFEVNEVKTTKLVVLKEATEVLCLKLIATAELKELELLVGTEKQFGVLGPLHIRFEECSAIISGVNAGKCTGLGDISTGLILVLGEAHLVFDSLIELGAAALFLVGALQGEGVHFECKSIVTVLEFVLGSALCLISPINTVVKEAEVKCEVAGTGDQKELKYSSGKLPLALDSTAGLFMSRNEEPEVDAAQEGAVKLKAAKEVKVVG